MQKRYFRIKKAIIIIIIIGNDGSYDSVVAVKEKSVYAVDRGYKLKS